MNAVSLPVLKKEEAELSFFLSVHQFIILNSKLYWFPLLVPWSQAVCGDVLVPLTPVNKTSVLSHVEIMTCSLMYEILADLRPGCFLQIISLIEDYYRHET